MLMFTLLNRTFFIRRLRSNRLRITILTLRQQRIDCMGFLLLAKLVMLQITYKILVADLLAWMRSFSKLKGSIWKIASCFLERKFLHYAAWRVCISNYIMFPSQNKTVYRGRGNVSYSPSLTYTWGIYTWSWSKRIQYHIKFYKSLSFHYSAVNLNPLEYVNALCYLWVWKTETVQR